MSCYCVNSFDFELENRHLRWSARAIFPAGKSNELTQLQDMFYYMKMLSYIRYIRIAPIAFDEKRIPSDPVLLFHFFFFCQKWDFNMLFPCPYKANCIKFCCKSHKSLQNISVKDTIHPIKYACGQHFPEFLCAPVKMLVPSLAAGIPYDCANASEMIVKNTDQ